MNEPLKFPFIAERLTGPYRDSTHYLIVDIKDGVIHAYDLANYKSKKPYSIYIGDNMYMLYFKKMLIK